MNPDNFFPPSVRRIGIPSPAGLPDAAAVADSCRILRTWGIEPVLGPHALTAGEETYFAADAAARLDDLNALIRDPSIDLVWCSRGGYGSAQILPGVDFDTLAARRLPVVGYSDITALHLAMLARRAGLPIAAKMADTLPRILESPVQIAAFRRLFERLNDPDRKPTQSVRLNPVTGTDGADVRGPVVAANLALIASLCGTPYLPDLTGAILILEDIHSLPRIVDRDLTQLWLAGVFDRVAAVVFGFFTECGTAAEQDRIFRRFARLTGKPVRSGLPFGHDFPSLAVANGLPGHLDINHEFTF